LAGVPAVWESIRKGVLTKVNETSVIQQSIFHGAVYLKSLLSNYSLPTSFIDSIVFKKVQEQVGGRLRIAVSGGAPLSAETQSFLSSVLTPILVGFGMTESNYLFI
jgi:long-chain acyl-CoA synthetase